MYYFHWDLSVKYSDLCSHVKDRLSVDFFSFANPEVFAFIVIICSRMFLNRANRFKIFSQSKKPKLDFLGVLYLFLKNLTLQ